MTIGQAVALAAKDSKVGAVQIGSWCEVATETARRWMADRTKIPAEAIEILRVKLPTLAGYLAQRAASNPPASAVA